MQPFDKHPADDAALQAYGDQLIDQGAQALILGMSTRRAYFPAIPSVQGVPAPAIAAAPEPVDQASTNTSGSLVWAAITTKFWGDQVGDFNKRVDEIVADLAAEEAAIVAKYDAQATPGAVSGGGQTPAGTTQNPQDTAEALERIGATMRAREEWQIAYEHHIMAGGEQAKALLAQGPTADNQRVARDAGFMPDMEFTGLLNLMTKSGARIFLPSPAPQSNQAGPLNFGEQLMNATGYAEKSFRASQMRFHPGGVPVDPSRVFDNTQGPRPTAIGPAAPPPPGDSVNERARAFQDPKNWTAPTDNKRWLARGFERSGAAFRVLGPVAAGVGAAIDQHTRDEGRPDIGPGEQDARAALRGSAAAGGSWAGAWTGARAGAAAGMQFRNPWVVGGLTIGGAVAGGIWGGTAVNTVIDEALYREEKTEVLAPGASFTPAPQPGTPPA